MSPCSMSACPWTDGFELAGRLKADPRLPHIRLVALTGYSRSHDRERGFAAGFDEYLVKPLDPVALDAIVARLISDVDRDGYRDK